MENGIRKLIKTLSRNLRNNVSAPDFFGLVRRLEKARPEQPRLGQAAHPRDENVRFGQVPFLRFPSSEIAEIVEGTTVNVDAVIMTYFFGLLGVNGPMPLDFTSYVFQRSYNQYDHAWRRFLDIIHHRMHVLFYRAFALNEQSISFDRSTDDPVIDIFKSFAGLPPDQVMANKKQERLFLGNPHHFGMRFKTRSALEDILRQVFRIHIEVKDFVIAPYDIPAENRAILGNPETAILGKNLQIGHSYYSATQKFEVRIGPVDYAVCQKLLPGTEGFDLMYQCTSLYLDRALDYDLTFTLNSASISMPRLGTNTARLGGCWLGSLKDPEITLVKHVYAQRASARMASDQRASAQGVINTERTYHG
jgi:type VI secretion system ImpH/TssG family protein